MLKNICCNFLLVFFIINLSFADIIYLKNGQALEGEIKSETPDTITLETKYYSEEVNKTDIKEIKRGSQFKKEEKVETSVNTDLEGKEAEFNMRRIDILPSKSYQGGALNYGWGRNFSSSVIELTENMEWVIMRGGSVELSDLDFLKTVGDDKKYKEVNDRIAARKTGRTLGIIGFVVGVVAMFSGVEPLVSDDDNSLIIIGTVVFLGGTALALSNKPLKHYLTGLESQEKALEYNKNLRKKLGLNLNVPF